MKRSIFIILIVAVVTGCGTTHVPEWQSSSFRFMEAYKKHTLAGNERMADMYFSKALAEIKKSGDLTVLARAHLTRYALECATLISRDDDMFARINAVDRNEENGAYYAFLSGDPASARPELLPPQYGSFIAAFRTGDAGAINEALRGIDDPLSRLIAAGITVTRHRADRETLLIAADTASANGWKRPLMTYLAQLEALLQEKGDHDGALAVRKRIELVGE